MEFSSLAVSVLATTGLFLCPIFLSVGIILLIRKRLRSHRVSPLTADLLRPAGHTLQQQIQDLQIDLFSQMLFTPLTMMMIGFYLLLQSYIDKRAMSTTVMLISGVVMLGLFVYGTTKTYKMANKVQHLKLGYSCELAVGQELDQIVRPQQHPYRVYHDIPFDGFNIDHLIICPNGVFVIETKGRSKPINNGEKQFKVRVENNALHFPNHVEKAPLEQVRRNVTTVRNWLNSATGTEVPVGGVLVLPGWFVDLRQKITFPYIVSAAALPKQLPQFRAGSLELAQIQAIAHQVEQKVRDVAKAG
ncbi:nuclease [Aeromonas hydrophila YL17]|nr:nuclease [Aeromonas hydrophila YL17]